MSRNTLIVLIYYRHKLLYLGFYLYIVFTRTVLLILVALNSLPTFQTFIYRYVCGYCVAFYKKLTKRKLLFLNILYRDGGTCWDITDSAT
jgi:hypothetical protein